jgi:hypothetical protein
MDSKVQRFSRVVSKPATHDEAKHFEQLSQPPQSHDVSFIRIGVVLAARVPTFPKGKRGTLIVQVACSCACPGGGKDELSMHHERVTFSRMQNAPELAASKAKHQRAHHETTN